jgi:hypothetical protein
MKKHVLPIAVIAALAISAYIEVGLWRECRQTGSILYCMRVLGN